MRPKIFSHSSSRKQAANYRHLTRRHKFQTNKFNSYAGLLHRDMQMFYEKMGLVDLYNPIVYGRTPAEPAIIRFVYFRLSPSILPSISVYPMSIAVWQKCILQYGTFKMGGSCGYIRNYDSSSYIEIDPGREYHIKIATRVPRNG